jgi:multiple sugar transport system permease protein
MAVKVLERRKTRRRSRLRTRQNIEGWLFIAPVVFGILAFQFFPIVVSMYASLTQWDGMNPPQFTGLNNYVTLFTSDPFFRLTLRNTILFTIGNIPFTIGLALCLALLCSRKMRGIALFRTAYFIPYITSVVSISLVWYWIYQPQGGVLNGLLSLVGIHGPAWLSDVQWALPAVILVSVWQSVGYPMVILLAGLQGVPETLHEAAKLDGASSWKRFWHVTFPLLTPTLFFLTITQFITSFQVFGIVLVMTRGGPANATNVYIYYLYQNAFSFGKMGYASAMAWILFVIIVIVTMIQWKLQKRWVFYG